MIELYLCRLPKQPGQPKPDRHDLASLVSWSDLTAPERASISMEQVAADIGQVELNGPAGQLIAATRKSLDGASELKAGSFRQALQDLHVYLMTQLTTADYKVAKAYRLGFALGETALLPVREGAAFYETVFEGHRVATILGWLRDLKSCLPPHSSEAVQASLTTWRTWYADPARGRAVNWNDEKELQRIRDYLRLQGESWRALLSGEKRGVDMLTTTDYVRAAGAMVSHIGELILRFLRSRSGLALITVTVVLLALAVGLAVAGPGPAMVAAIISLLGSLGITSASAGAVVRRALGPVQQALWESDLTTAISTATTRLPPTQPRGSTSNR